MTTPAPAWEQLGETAAEEEFRTAANEGLVRYDVYSSLAALHRTELAALSDVDHAAAVGAMGVAYLAAWRRLGGVVFE